MKYVHNFFTLMLACVAGVALAQDPAGTNLFIRLDEFDADGVKWVNCGTDAAFDFTTEMTLECWVRVDETNTNQKFLGKVSNTIDQGYVMGVDQGKVYPEVWNPSNVNLLAGFVLPNGYWVHWAVTFKAGDKMIGYVNGEDVGEVAVPNNPMSSHSNPFVIGCAPWDMANFQLWGEIDEVVAWNVVRTPEEIKASMHTRLAGNEAGLTAYYDFDDGAGTTLSDLGPNGLDGTLNGFTDDWYPSRAVIGNGTVAAMEDVTGIWNGLNTNPSFNVTDNGLSLTSSLSADDYAVWAHNSGSGTSTQHAPANAPNGYESFAREWYVNEVGSVAANFAFDLSNASGGAASIASGEPTPNYTLLWRANTSDDYTPLYGANTYNGSVAVFNDVDLETGYYTLGVAEEQMMAPSAIADVAQTVSILAFPNPASDQLKVQLNGLEAGTVQLIDAIGRTVWMEQVPAGEQVRTVDVSTFAKGSYMLKASAGTGIATQLIVVE